MPEQIGVSLSGGGFRSTLFGIGALHFLAEAGLNEAVKVVSSVSGGGYANATLAAYRIAYSAMTTDEFRDALLPVVSVLAAEPVNLLGVPSPVVPARLRKRLWSAVTGIATDTPLMFAPDDRLHVFCATNVHDGEYLYLTNRYLWNEWLGAATTTSMTLEEATAASAALPPVFPPVPIDTATFDLGRRPDVPRRLYLVDGGITDHLGDEGMDLGLVPPPGMEDPEDEEGGAADAGAIPSRFKLVIDASVPHGRRRDLPLATVPILRTPIPLAGPASAMIRAGRILFGNQTKRHIEELREEFGAASGAVVSLTTTVGAPSSMADRSLPRWAPLWRSGVDWDQAIRVVSGIRTGPYSVGPEVASSALLLGYTKTWVALTEVGLIGDFEPELLGPGAQTETRDWWTLP